VVLSRIGNLGSQSHYTKKIMDHFDKKGSKDSLQRFGTITTDKVSRSIHYKLSAVGSDIIRR
jgi:hypothetical protein